MPIVVLILRSYIKNVSIGLTIRPSNRLNMISPRMIYDYLSNKLTYSRLFPPPSAPPSTPPPPPYLLLGPGRAIYILRLLRRTYKHGVRASHP